MGTPVLQIERLNVSLRGTKVLEDINLQLEEGDFIGLIGPNGAGKTVLLKTILGLIKADSGRIVVYGEEALKQRHLLGYVPQYANFDKDFPLSVREVVLMGRLARTRLFGGYKAADHACVEQIMQSLELQSLAETRISKLSGGQLQRVLIARALAQQPKVLLLDEPTASLDTRVGLNVYDLLDNLAKEITIILVSHDIGVIARHVKTIACLNRKLHYHHSKELSSGLIEEVYGCPVDLLAHGHAHRVLPDHQHAHGEEKRGR